MAIFLRTIQKTSGGNHGAILYKDENSFELGTCHWDPARAQFAFAPNDQGLVLSAADQASIVTILNSLSR